MRRDGWPLYLLMGLMAASGAGWFGAAVAIRGADFELWGFGLPAGLLPAVGIVHVAAALGLWLHRPWAWALALAYAGAGAVSAAPLLATGTMPPHPVLAGLELAALATAPYLVRHHGAFLRLPLPAA